MNLSRLNTGITQSLGYAVATVAGSVLSGIALILLSRKLGPAEFGAFSVAFSLTQLSARIADFGLSIALQKYIAKHYQTDVLAVSAAYTFGLTIKLVAALIAVIIGFIAGPYIGTTIFKLSDPRMAGLGISLASVIILFEYVVLLHQSGNTFAQAAWMNSIQAALKLLFVLSITLLLAPSAYSSYLIYGLLPVVALIYGYIRLPKAFRTYIQVPPQLKKQLLNTAKFSYVATLSTAVADQADVLLVKSFLTEYQTGIFAAASRVALLCSVFVQAIGAVLNTRIAQYHGHHLRHYYQKSFKVGLIALGLTPLLVWAAKPLVLITAGSAYLESVPSLQILMVSIGAFMATIPMSAISYSVNYPQYFMLAGLLQSGLLVIGSFLLMPTLGMEGAAWAKAGMRAVVLAFTYFVAYIVLRRNDQ